MHLYLTIIVLLLHRFLITVELLVGTPGDDNGLAAGAPEYIKAVLRDKKPNISGLFEQRDNRIYRTNRTFWGPEFRGTLVGEIECCGLYLW